MTLQLVWGSATALQGCVDVLRLCATHPQSDEGQGTESFRSVLL